MEREIFDAEQEHLNAVYGDLARTKRQLDGQIAELNSAAREDKQDILTNLRYDSADDEVLLESYGEIETWNRYIDTYNVRSDVLSDRLSKVELLLASPYFARVQLRFEEDEEPEDFYIGRTSFSAEGSENAVIDWRAPVAETYYSQENGRTSYVVDGEIIETELLLRRQFDIERDRLHAYFDTSLAIEDPLLLQSLSRRHTDRLQDITVTIQKEQNAVIRHPEVPALLVNGIAGSGKTSVMLQRIAYLFYRQRGKLRPEQVVLLTLNPVFREYIDGVLPDLGERNPDSLTWMEFLRRAHVPIPDPGTETKTESLRRIEAGLPELRLEAEDVLPVGKGEESLLSRGEVLEILRRNDGKNRTGVRLIQVTADVLTEEATIAAKRREKKRREQEGEEASDARGEENNVQSRYRGVLDGIQDCRWLNIEHIGQRLLGRKKITSIEWLWLRMLLTGECERNVRYVCIDEVQDYTPAQMLVLTRWFVNARFLMLGDEYQAIRGGTVSFAELEELFRGQHRRFVELPLETSYRSTPEITALFASLLPAQRRMRATSVQREGTPPVFLHYDKDAGARRDEDNAQGGAAEAGVAAEVGGAAEAGDAAQVGRAAEAGVAAEVGGAAQSYEEAFSRLIEEAAREEGLTAVLCAGRRSIRRLREIPAAAELTEVGGRAQLPKRGVFLITLAYAKGLEFDHVILADADAEQYPDDTLGRHRLYTAISRATQRITILSEGEPTPLLAEDFQ